MASRRLAAVLPHLRRLASAGADDAGDSQLLERFLRRRDPDAFAALVRRHGPMVLGVCRRLLPEPHDAEDAFQATFLVLLRRASDVGRPERLGSWLYGVAYRVALKARGREARRRRGERPLEDAPVEGGVADLIWRELRPVIDEELNRLPEKYRAPVVLCYLEGISKRAAARQLGWPEGTLSTRLHRAREILRRRLTRRGLALSAGVVAAALSRGATAAAVPAPLAAAAVAPPAPAAVAALAEGALRAMWWNKVKLLTAVCAALLLAAGLGRAVLTVPAAPPAPEQKPAPPAPAEARREPGPAKSFRLGKDVVKVVWSPDGKLMASQARRTEPRKGGTEGELDWFSTVRVWDAATGKEVASLGELKNSGLIGLAFSPDGQTLALSFFRQIPEGAWLELWDARKGQLRKKIEMDYGRVVPRIAYAPDGKTLAVLYAGDDDRDRTSPDLRGGVRLFDVASGKPLRTIRGHKHMAISLAFSPDGKLLATGGSQHDNDIRLWDVATGKELRRIEAAAAVQAVAFSPNGKAVAGTGWDSGIALWDVASGKKQRDFKVVMPDPLGVTFSPDGKLLAVSSEVEKEGTRGVDTYLLELTLGEPLRRWPDATASLTFTPDGRRLAILGRDGTVSLWDVKAPFAESADPKADYGFGPLIDRLIRDKKTDSEVVDALFLAALARYPEERERKFVADNLAKKKDRREAMVDAVWALINSKEYWAHLDVLKENDQRGLLKKK
jgi:RNA polymerase sigma factor (sigma-70 family)